MSRQGSKGTRSPLWTVLRLGLDMAGRTRVVTWNWCCDRVGPFGCRDTALGVATEPGELGGVATKREPSMCDSARRQSARRVTAHAYERSVIDSTRQCAHDPPAAVYSVVHCLRSLF